MLGANLRNLILFKLFWSDRSCILAKRFRILFHLYCQLFQLACPLSLDGESIITSRPELFFGNAMKSRIESAPPKIEHSLSNPKAIPACGGAPNSNAFIRKPNCSCASSCRESEDLEHLPLKLFLKYPEQNLRPLQRH
jgi:hypothetical protein